MPWQITKDFDSTEHIVAHTAYATTAPQGVPVAHLGFLENDGSQNITLFTTQGAATAFATIWESVNLRTDTGHTLASMTITEKTLT